jgi:hypothetical protein
VPYLAQLLAGYRTGLDHDPPESGEAVRAALTEEDDAFRRGILLGLLANSLVRSDHPSSKIGEAARPQCQVTEATQRPLELRYRRLRFEAIAERMPAV